MKFDKPVNFKSTGAITAYDEKPVRYYLDRPKNYYSFGIKKSYEERIVYFVDAKYSMMFKQYIL